MLEDCTVSLLGFLFERTKKEGEVAVDSSPSPDEGAPRLEAEESLHGEPNIDQIRDELAEIAKLIGPGDSYDMLADTDQNLTTVDLLMKDVQKLIPHAFNKDRLNDIPDDGHVTILVTDLF